ncbi:MAG: hypothetical protein RBS99_07235 [Rhodospirillales bacterium]|nr:hypothetical protein [Rhodospirillales bacterium]
MRRHEAAIEGRRHLVAANGWKIEGKKGIVGHGGHRVVVARMERRLGREFFHYFNELRHSGHPLAVRLSGKAGPIHLSERREPNIL